MYIHIQKLAAAGSSFIYLYIYLIILPYVRKSTVNNSLVIKHIKTRKKLTSASRSLNTLAVIRNNQC